MTVELLTKSFAASEPGPHLLITGGVHGDEFEPIAAIYELQDRFHTAGNPTPLLRGCVTLVPIVNRTAFLRGDRSGEDEQDLARTCPGKPTGTVTEQTAFALSELIRTSDAYLDLHSGGTTFSVLPLTGYMLHPDETVLTQQREMARAFNLPIVWGTSAQLEGRSLSVAREANIPAIYAEYLGSGQCDPEGVTAYVKGCLNVLALFGMIASEPAKSLVEISVEDNRPESGHMQVCHPAPATGFFEPYVTLGQKIEQGEAFGRVIEIDSGRVHQVLAEHSGLVLVLRTFRRVLQGESVGVILETELNSTH